MASFIFGLSMVACMCEKIFVFACVRACIIKSQHAYGAKQIISYDVYPSFAYSLSACVECQRIIHIHYAITRSSAAELALRPALDSHVTYVVHIIYACACNVLVHVHVILP